MNDLSGCNYAITNLTTLKENIRAYASYAKSELKNDRELFDETEKAVCAVQDLITFIEKESCKEAVEMAEQIGKQII